MEAILVDCDIEVNDISIFQRPAVRDSVADDFVD
jgi:hypothetical protein